MATEPRIIKIYETTLRDGEQTPGVNYFPEEKLQIAQALADMGCDTLDCGFPISSPGEFEAVRLIASKIDNAEILAIGRANIADIDRAWEAVKIAAHPVIEPFISISPLHREVKLGKTREQVREMARVAVAHARTLTENVDFALEDTTRTEFDFILEVCDALLKEGVRFITICDTVGVALPWEFGKLIADLKREFPQIRISAHCHDDLGLAVANALTGLRNGAERVDTCINGLGERAGNAATEDIVMAIRTRSADLGMDVKVDTTKLVPTSRLIAKLSGMQPQWTKSVVGANAFAHGGGIHQDGVLKDARTYEIMTPESVGLTAADRRMHVGKLSGRAALDAQMRELGYQLEREQLNKAFDMAKLLLGKKKVLEEMDMRYIADSITGSVDQQPAV
ncbi:2-isopropylmalate synthase [Ktedonosporobacter rubrisoli]|uniref:2-isopropylmalate synthase n=1 Tax=Ktedonosporobacter rubrisoli TaxID=2509675 RepID=A0A4P6JUL4_KTERU|nr:2-isopropylmalate synthase [Ktedonosporobacter rubrisoli]QBD79338.1 2-isopropylmalate synthase [Ktedonosporobacter rubrisoli]